MVVGAWSLCVRCIVVRALVQNITNGLFTNRTCDCNITASSLFGEVYWAKEQS